MILAHITQANQSDFCLFFFLYIFLLSLGILKKRQFLAQENSRGNCSISATCSLSRTFTLNTFDSMYYVHAY